MKTDKYGWPYLEYPKVWPMLPELCCGCHKVEKGKCTVYEDAWAKTRTLGCAFSPHRENKEFFEGKKRVGQQRNKRGKAGKGWRTYANRKADKKYGKRI